MKLLMTLVLSIISFALTAQTTPARSWVDTEIDYTDSSGNVIKVYNSLPKGGGGYISSGGKEYSYVIFWTRVVNKSSSPLTITMKLPTDSISIFPSPDSYIRLLIPPDTMTVGKISLGDYGLTNLKSILDNAFNKPNTLKQMLQPGEGYMFYTTIFIHEARGTARTSYVLKEHDLYYRVSIDPYSTQIPCGCGQINFKDGNN